DPVTLANLARCRVLRADLGDAADQHPARSGDGVLHLAARLDDLHHLLADVAPGRLELAERRGVDVEVIDVDRELVGPQRRARGAPSRLLREDPRSPHAPAQAVRIKGHAAPLPRAARAEPATS